MKLHLRRQVDSMKRIEADATSVSVWHKATDFKSSFSCIKERNKKKRS